jgi:hypothetical protein
MPQTRKGQNRAFQRAVLQSARADDSYTEGTAINVKDTAIKISFTTIKVKVTAIKISFTTIKVNFADALNMIRARESTRSIEK